MSRAWDEGIVWSASRTAAPQSAPLEVSYVSNQVLRTANDGAEDEHILRLIDSAVEACEAYSLNPRPYRAIMPQTWQQLLSDFPRCSGRIALQRAPVIEVLSLLYYDEDGVQQEMAGSPAEYLYVPSGAYTPAEIHPLPGSTWPATQIRRDAVTITFRAGYENREPPARVLDGIALFIGERYKQRSLSVMNQAHTPAVLQLATFWEGPY
jgi:uncharacterized phiE125 gp8 family phage protein